MCVSEFVTYVCKYNKLVTIYQEIQNNIGYFLKLVRLGKKEGLTPEQIINLIKMANNIHELKEKFHHQRFIWI
jgi:hypothetical protein